MTEIPEHLLARSRARRAGLAGGESAPAAPDTAAAAQSVEEAPAGGPPAAAPPPSPVAKAAEPAPPWVEAAERRTRIPVWAMPVLAFLPIWAVLYMTTNDRPTPKEEGPLAVGATVYSSCASCHGGAGGGGVGPALNGGAVLTTFEDPGSQARWVLLGTAGYKAEGTATYGTAAKPVGGGGVMPGWPTLTPQELLAVIRHERETLSGETFDLAAWQDSIAALEQDPNPTVAAAATEWKAVVEEWASAPAG